MCYRKEESTFKFVLTVLIGGLIVGSAFLLLLCPSHNYSHDVVYTMPNIDDVPKDDPDGKH